MVRLAPLKLLGIVVTAVTVVGAVSWLFAADTTVERPRTDRASLERRLGRPPPARVVRPPSPGAAEPIPPEAPVTSPPRELSPAWRAQRQEVLDAVFRRVVPPSPTVSRAVAGDYRRRSRERRAYLAALEVELVDLIENEPDPYTRWDAEISLAEIYLAQAEVLDSTWIPDSFSDERARHRLAVLERRAAVARDKADLVVQLANAEAERAGDVPADDPVRLRMDALDIRLTHGG